MFANSVLITGSSRGIGLDLVRKLADKTHHLFAACRRPADAVELQKIAEQHNNVVVMEMDVTKEEHIAVCARAIEETVGEKGLNCIINNAGQLTRGNLEDTTADDLRRLYEVNVIAPAMVVKTFLPLLKKASACSTKTEMSVSRAAILNMSSIMASIASTTSVNYAYRMSKCALNMLTKNLSIELKPDQILAVNIHPGWVQTDMGGSSAPVTVEQSVSGIINTASAFNEEHNGGLYAWNGDSIPW